MGEELVILLLGVFVALSSVLEGYIDAKKINKGTNIEHGLSAVVRVVVSTGVCWLLTDEFIPLIMLVVYTLSIYWIVFDVAVNLFRGLRPLYIGKTSWTDRTIRNLGFDHESFIMVKLMSLIVSIITYFNC